ncbi:MAG: hypothetical protein ACREYE_09540 [Gammaproteobacteria bacterium]
MLETNHLKRLTTRLRSRRLTSALKRQEGKMGYILLWALGIPIPVLLVIFLLRGCD